MARWTGEHCSWQGQLAWPQVGCPPAPSSPSQWHSRSSGCLEDQLFPVGLEVQGVHHRAAFLILVPVLGCVSLRTQPEGVSFRGAAGVFSAPLSQAP